VLSNRVFDIFGYIVDGYQQKQDAKNIAPFWIGWEREVLFWIRTINDLSFRKLYKMEGRLPRSPIPFIVFPRYNVSRLEEMPFEDRKR